MIAKTDLIATLTCCLFDILFAIDSIRQSGDCMRVVSDAMIAVSYWCQVWLVSIFASGNALNGLDVIVVFESE